MHLAQKTRETKVLNAVTLDSGIAGGREYNAAYREEDNGCRHHESDDSEYQPVFIMDALWGDGNYLLRGDDRKRVQRLAALLRGSGENHDGQRMDLSGLQTVHA